MDFGNISHRNAFNDCYALNDEELIINIRTGKDIKGVNIIHGDPYLEGKSKKEFWYTDKDKMTLEYELKYHNVWSIVLKPKYKREQYYFEIYTDNEKIYYLENDFYTAEELGTFGLMHQYFKFAWLNEADIFKTPSYVKDIIWYQIMPDRFRRGEISPKSRVTKPWKCEDKMTYYDFYGGDIKGIIEKLKYLKDLGISGLYLTPIMQSTSNHKYNVSDYYTIDCDFGKEEDIKELIKRAHLLGMKVMLDAVFNHSSAEFKPWIDVMERGKDSPYYNWYFVNKLPLKNNKNNTKDGSFYSFSFNSGMPKLNTNNIEVMNYLIDVLKYWIENWKVDGIRFDVGDEISHAFIKKIRRELKAINPDIYLLGEVWNDSVQYLQGDEYDSVMNYPFANSINDFWLFKNKTCEDLMYSLNRCYSMYKKESNKVLFNLLDSHDVCRAFSRCGEDIDVYLQQFTLLMTLEGSPSIYYGTEIAMSGNRDPLNRKCMPWQEIESGKYDDILNEVKKLINIRNNYNQCKSSNIKWSKTNSRLICYEKCLDGSKEKLGIIMNADNKKFKINKTLNILYNHKYGNGILDKGGILIYLI